MTLGMTSCDTSLPTFYIPFGVLFLCYFAFGIFNLVQDHENASCNESEVWVYVLITMLLIIFNSTIYFFYKVKKRSLHWIIIFQCAFPIWGLIDLSSGNDPGCSDFTETGLYVFGWITWLTHLVIIMAWTSIWAKVHGYCQYIDFKDIFPRDRIKEAFPGHKQAHHPDLVRRQSLDSPRRVQSPITVYVNDPRRRSVGFKNEVQQYSDAGRGTLSELKREARSSQSLQSLDPRISLTQPPPDGQPVYNPLLAAQITSKTAIETPLSKEAGAGGDLRGPIHVSVTPQRSHLEVPGRHSNLNADNNRHSHLNADPRRHPSLNADPQRHSHLNADPRRHPSLNTDTRRHPSLSADPRRHQSLNADTRRHSHPRQLNVSPNRHRTTSNTILDDCIFSKKSERGAKRFTQDVDDNQSVQSSLSDYLHPKTTEKAGSTISDYYHSNHDTSGQNYSGSSRKGPVALVKQSTETSVVTIQGNPMYDEYSTDF